MEAAINALKYEYTNSIITRITPGTINQLISLSLSCSYHMHTYPHTLHAHMHTYTCTYTHLLCKKEVSMLSLYVPYTCSCGVYSTSMCESASSVCVWLLVRINFMSP